MNVTAATDQQLLACYAQDRAEAAFAELVRRHVDLAYSTAFRLVRSPQTAEEITQSAFLDLAQSAARLRPDTILAAWLHQVVWRTGVDAIRRETRRRLREQIATEMNATSTPDPCWLQVEPLLDEALSALDDPDRAAVLLRYFENKSLREVGTTLGVSDDAAQKRVSRAVERLREFFTKRGITVGAGGLTVAISANAVSAAPAALATAITAAAVAGSAATVTVTATATKIIAMTTLQKIAFTATVAVLTGTGIYVARQNVLLHGQIQTVQNQLTPLTQQVDGLQARYADATNRLGNLLAETDRLKNHPEHAELLKLRGEVTRLNNDLNRMSMGRSQPTTTSATNDTHYIATDQLQNSGYATPEATFKTMEWAKRNSDYQTWLNSFSEADRQQSPGDFTEDSFRQGLSEIALIKGFDFFAKKTLDDHHLELKARFNTENMTRTLIIPFVESAGEYKIDGDFHSYQQGWETNTAAQLAN